MKCRDEQREEIGCVTQMDLSEFDHRLRLLTHGSYERVPCERGILIVSGPKGRWFESLTEASTWLRGWQV